MVIHPNRMTFVFLLGAAWALSIPHRAAADGGEGAASDAPSAEPRKKGLPFGLGIGLSVERRMTPDPNASDVWAVIPFPRFIARGLGLAFSFPGIDAGVVAARGGGSTELGVLRINPVMAGVVWRQPLGKRTSAEMHVVAGYAFNSAGRPGRKPLEAQVVVPQAVIDVDDSFAWETRVGLWHDLGPRIGLMLGSRYLHTRPRFTFADGSQSAWRADRVTLEAGLAFTLIKAPWERDPAAPRRWVCAERGEERANVGSTVIARGFHASPAPLSGVSIGRCERLGQAPPPTNEVEP